MILRFHCLIDHQLNIISFLSFSISYTKYRGFILEKLFVIEILKVHFAGPKPRRHYTENLYIIFECRDNGIHTYTNLYKIKRRIP